MKINLRTLSKWTFILIVCQVVVFRFFNIHEIFNKVILVFVFVCFLGNRFRQRKSTYAFNCFLLLFIFILGLNGMKYGMNDAFKANFLMILYPVVDAAFLVSYVKNYPDELKSFMNRICVPLNAYMWLNIVVMFIQMRGTYFLVGFSDWHNTSYWDLISGLFGYSSTHVVCMFSIFVIIYDLALLKRLSGVNRQRMKINTYAITIILLVLSFWNDNTAFFLILPLTLLYWILFSSDIRRVSKLSRILTGLAGAMVLFVIVFAVVPEVSEYYYEEVFYKVVGLFQNAAQGTAVTHGSMERFAQIVYGMNYLDGWRLGAGFNETGLFHGGYFGFPHFGNSSAGGMVCLGGIWSWLVLSLTYGEYSRKILKTNSHKFIFAASFIYVLMLTVYTTLFTDVSVALSSMFVAIAFWYAEAIGATDKDRVINE